MKFADAIKGTAAEDEVVMPGLTTKSGLPVVALVRPLLVDEEEIALRRAREDAKAAGVDEPKDGVPLYDSAMMVHRVALGYVDKDSPVGAREPFFADAAQVRKNFGADEIGYLYERHEVWQNEVSPSTKKATPEQLYKLMIAVAADDTARSFLELAPALRWNLTRFTALQHLASHADKSPPGSSSPDAH